MSISQIHSKLTIEIPNIENLYANDIYTMIPPAPRANIISRVPRFFMNTSPNKKNNYKYIPNIKSFSP